MFVSLKYESSFVLMWLFLVIYKKNKACKFLVELEVFYNYFLLNRTIKHQTMKVFSIATFITVLFFYSVGAVSIEKRRKFMLTALNECKAKENAPESDFEKIIASQFPETHQGHCLIACVLEDFAIVSLISVKIIWIFF